MEKVNWTVILFFWCVTLVQCSEYLQQQIHSNNHYGNKSICETVQPVHQGDVKIISADVAVKFIRKKYADERRYKNYCKEDHTSLLFCKHVNQDKLADPSCTWKFEAEGDCELVIRLFTFQGVRSPCRNQHFTITDLETTYKSCGQSRNTKFVSQTGKLHVKHYKKPRIRSAIYTGYVTCEPAVNRHTSPGYALPSDLSKQPPLPENHPENPIAPYNLPTGTGHTVSEHQKSPEHYQTPTQFHANEGHQSTHDSYDSYYSFEHPKNPSINQQSYTKPSELHKSDHVLANHEATVTYISENQQADAYKPEYAHLSNQNPGYIHPPAETTDKQEKPKYPPVYLRPENDAVDRPQHHLHSKYPNGYQPSAHSSLKPIKHQMRPNQPAKDGYGLQGDISKIPYSPLGHELSPEKYPGVPSSLHYGKETPFVYPYDPFPVIDSYITTDEQHTSFTQYSGGQSYEGEQQTNSKYPSAQDTSSSYIGIASPSEDNYSPLKPSVSLSYKPARPQSQYIPENSFEDSSYNSEPTYKPAVEEPTYNPLGTGNEYSVNQNANTDEYYSSEIETPYVEVSYTTEGPVEIYNHEESSERPQYEPYKTLGLSPEEKKRLKLFAMNWKKKQLQQNRVLSGRSREEPIDERVYIPS